MNKDIFHQRIKNDFCSRLRSQLNETVCTIDLIDIVCVDFLRAGEWTNDMGRIVNEMQADIVLFLKAAEFAERTLFLMIPVFTFSNLKHFHGILMYIIYGRICDEMVTALGIDSDEIKVSETFISNVQKHLDHVDLHVLLEGHFWQGIK